MNRSYCARKRFERRGQIENGEKAPEGIWQCKGRLEAGKSGDGVYKSSRNVTYDGAVLHDMTSA